MKHLVTTITRNTPKQLLLALKYDLYTKASPLYTIEFKTSKNVRNNMPIYTAVIRLK